MMRVVSKVAREFFFLAAALGVAAFAQAADTYPPAGATRGDVVVAPGGQFSLEQWSFDDGGSQTWLASPSGDHAKLPEIEVPDAGQNTGELPTSDYNFSNDGNYLLRVQKIAHGTDGAYIYKRVNGLHYAAAVTDLHVRASAYFTQLTGMSWDAGTAIVEFSAWAPDNSLALTLRGYSTDRQFSIMGWRCLYSLASGQFSVRADWEAANKAAIQAADTAPTPSSGVPSKARSSNLRARLANADAQLNATYQQLRKRLNSAGREALKEEEIAWLHERDQIAGPESRLRSIMERQQELQQRLSQLGE